jgi:hypothetical protein
MPVEGVKIEQRYQRGCGFRRPGLYLVGEGYPVPCDRLMMKIPVCPCCGETLRQLRSIRVFNPFRMLGLHGESCTCDKACPACYPPEKGGLIWVGEKFYHTPEDFIKEAHFIGVSRRIPKLPKELGVGDWIYLVHPWGNELDLDEPARIFYVFRIREVQQILTPMQAEDLEYVKEVQKKGFTPILETPDAKNALGEPVDENFVKECE